MSWNSDCMQVKPFIKYDITSRKYAQERIFLYALSMQTKQNKHTEQKEFYIFYLYYISEMKYVIGYFTQYVQYIKDVLVFWYGPVRTGTKIIRLLV
jgi:hypothetical protein